MTCIEHTYVRKNAALEKAFRGVRCYVASHHWLSSLLNNFLKGNELNKLVGYQSFGKEKIVPAKFKVLTKEYTVPILKPIGGHLGKTTRSSVFVSKSYYKALECSLKTVSFDNFKRKYY